RGFAHTIGDPPPGEDLRADLGTLSGLSQPVVHGGHSRTTGPGDRALGCRGTLSGGHFPAPEKGGAEGMVQIPVQSLSLHLYIDAPFVHKVAHHPTTGHDP